MAFDLTGLDRWTDEREFKVDQARVAAYAAATNDADPNHAAGEQAPPVFAVVPVWEAMQAAVESVTPADAVSRIVHADQDIRQHRPMAPGDVLRSRAAPVGVQVRGMGTTLVTKTESRDAGGALVNEQFFTMLFRGVSDGASAGSGPPEHKLTAAIKAGGPVAEVTEHLDADQTFRYAAASGDRLAIHLDEDAARSLGLPGIIVHGLCTMAFAGRAVIDHACAGEAARLTRLAVRFSRPVLPGQAITTRLYAAGPGAFGFEVLNPDGQAVVKDGWAEVQPAGGPGPG